MSKAALRKELTSFDADQLRELVMNIYDSSKEAKAYLEFFLNPDADAMRQKKIDLIFKELKRVKRRNLSKARMSVIRKHIKEFASFGVGYEQTESLMMGAISLSASMEKYVSYTSAQENGLKRLISEYMKLAEKNGELSKGVERLSSMASSPDLCTKHMQVLIKQWTDDALGEIRPSFN